MIASRFGWLVVLPIAVLFVVVLVGGWEYLARTWPSFIWVFIGILIGIAIGTRLRD